MNCKLRTTLLTTLLATLVAGGMQGCVPLVAAGAAWVLRLLR